MDYSRYVAPHEAARALGVTPQRIAQLVAEGRLRAHRTPLGRIVERASLDEEIARRSAQRAERTAVAADAA